MATIPEQILEEFYRQLAKVDGFTDVLVKDLRDLFSTDKKPKAVDVVKVLSKPSKESVP